MFYLAKFCRICINSGENLLDINSKDYDLVKLSKKLEVCTKMVINKEDLSTQICMSCVEKLRISYVFQQMCTKSDGILQEYLAKLLSTTENQEKFLNSELKVTLSPLPVIKTETLHKIKHTNLKKIHLYKEYIPKTNLRYPYSYKHNKNKFTDNKAKRKRVSKGQRCSLLKKLLSTINNNTLDKSVTPIPKKPIQKKTKGGLKDLLVFIKDYDFGYKINEPIQELHENTALDKLENFSKTFFYTDFSDYRETILSVIHDQFDSSDDDDMFTSYDEEEDRRLWHNIKQENVEEVEEVLIEPDIKIKTEFISESEYETGYLPSELVQACYDENSSTVNNAEDKEFVDYETYLGKNGNYMNNYLQNQCSSGHSSLSIPPSSLELLQQFTNRTKNNGKKSMSPHNLKCRTRGQPFINPQLMEQFQKRSFKCDTCNRSFKSPGYLHSHCTKMGH